MKKVLIILCLLFIAFGSVAQQKTIVFTLHPEKRIQQVRNIGASGCWYSEEIGKQWPAVKKQRIAELLFSQKLDNSGKPKGIGLSAFRFNIGGGTTEQGDSSGIRDPARRVECFLSPDGTYNWNKQSGYIWIMQQARNYGVKDLIAFVNSPPVQFTKNGLGYKLEKDFNSNLKETNYKAYADFLAKFIKHFEQNNLKFNYISPVNEPQWDWIGKFGEAKQEGSPWSNKEIYQVTKALDSSLTANKLNTKILLTEAAMLDQLYAGNSKASKQIADFWNVKSPLYIGNLKHATNFIEGHSYFTDNGDSNLINVRRSLKDSLKRYGKDLEYWQSEYSMLGDGYLDKATGRRTAMDCALFLAKVVHHDFVIGNATAWHYWNAYEPGGAEFNTRYYLIALNRNRSTDTANLYSVTKNLWALGHYSLFVRPGMYRIQTSRNDGLTDEAAAQQIMLSAFTDDVNKQLVVNVINYTNEAKDIDIQLNGLKAKNLHLRKYYITSAKEGDDIKPYTVTGKNKKSLQPKVLPKSAVIKLPARSISTLIFSS